MNHIKGIQYGTNFSSGGAITIYKSPRTTIKESKFKNNEVTKEQDMDEKALGGALFISDRGYEGDLGYISDVTIENTEFFNNKVSDNGGAFFYSSCGNVKIDGESEFVSNEAKQYGGAIVFSIRGTDYSENNTSFEINNSVFKKNKTGILGGAINILKPENIITDDSKDNKYFNSLKMDNIEFSENKANDIFYLDKEKYPKIYKINQTNMKNIKSLSEPATISKDKNIAYNNYDVSFVSDQKIKENGGGGGSTEYYYEVTYDANTKDFDGKVPEDNKEYTKNEEVTVLDSGDLSREGYIFEGWNTQADGKGKSYKAKDTFNITEDTTLYAQWKKDDILDKVNHNAYLIGYPDGTVKPDGNITRAEVSAIYFRLMTDEAREELWRTKNNYTDVSKEAWYNNEVSTLSNAGILKGYPQGDFKPDGAITRAEFASMTARFLGDKVKATNGKLNDLEDHWAKDDINKLVTAGIIEGYEDGSFKPDKSITRAEATKIVNGILERTPHKDGLLEDMKVWPDNNEKAWYYVDIQEATNTHEYERKTNKDSEKWTKILPNRDWNEYEKQLEEKLGDK